MLMSIGEIADRYSICKLKIERTNYDFNSEYEALKEELENFTDIQDKVQQLYEINGKIWDLEYDIRRGKEKELGLEEVGKRAIKIREYNGQRVRIKNEINQLTNTGFMEKKSDHASEEKEISSSAKEPKVIISFTTVPERLLNENIGAIPQVLSSLCNQEFEYEYEVHFNIPHVHKVKNKEYIIPSWMKNLEEKYHNLKIYRTEDYGPPTKIIPTIERVKDPNTIIIVVDDDFIYHKEMIKEHYRWQNQLTNTAVGYDGLGVSIPIYGDARDRFVALVNDITKVDTLQHYRSVSYKRKFFQNDFFDTFVGKTLSDDILVSYYMRYKEIDMVVVPILNHVKIETFDEWSDKLTTPSFPLVQPAESVKDTGANDPEILKIQPKFFAPKELEHLIEKSKSGNELYDLGIMYETDKARPHNYTFFYDSKLKNKKQKIKNILEIGIYNGGSLRMWRDYFPEASVYGIDIIKCNINEDRIFAYQMDQSDRIALKSFCDLVDANYFDMIVDDGSHIMKDQQISLGFLFKYLRPGGIYILEDLHTSMDIHENRFGLKDSKFSTYDMLKNFEDGGKIDSNWMTEEEVNYLNENIESVELHIPPGENIFGGVTSMILKKY